MEREALIQPGDAVAAEVAAPIAEERTGDGIMAVIWSVCGILISSLIFDLQKKTDYLFEKMAICVVVVPAVYYGSFRWRNSYWMRERRGWIGTGIINCVVSVVTIGVGLLQNFGVLKGEDGEHRMKVVMVAISICLLMEIGHPIFDFGVTQYVLRLPVQMTVANYRKISSPFLQLMGTILFLIFGTFWYPYSLHQFQKKAADDVRKPLLEKISKLTAALEREEAVRKAKEDRVAELDQEVKKLEAAAVEQSNRLAAALKRSDELAAALEKLEADVDLERASTLKQKKK